jgi:DNA-binding transcriptional MerR regulator
MAENVERGFRGKVAMKMAGITYRQLDYWARTHLVEPSIRPADGSGTQRLYSFTDIVHLKLISGLLGTGVSLQKVRRAIEWIRDELQIPLEQVPMLVSDGETVFAVTSPGEIIDILAGGQGVFAIAVDKVYRDLEGTIAAFKKPSDEEEVSDSDEGTEASG